LSSFPRNIALAGFVAIALVVGFATPAFAVTGDATIASPSVWRDTSTGNLDYSLTVDASGFSGPDGVCEETSTCTVTLSAQLVSDGSWTDIDSMGGVAYRSDPTTFSFSGNTPIGQIEALRAHLTGPSQTVTGPSYSVSDTYPTTTVGVEVNSVSRDSSTDELSYDVVGSASYFGMAGGPCYEVSCVMALQGKYSSDGSWNDIETHGISATSYPASYHFDSYAPFPIITAVRIEIRGSSGAKVDSSSQSESDVEGTPSVAITSQAFSRDPSTTVSSFSVYAASTNQEVTDGACPVDSGTCQMRLIVKFVDGSTADWEDYNLSSDTSPETVHFASSGFGGDLVEFARVDVAGGGGVLHGYWHTVSEQTGPLLPSETRSSSNGAENICHCAVNDPIDTATGEFFQSSTDVSLPGAGPSLDVARTYSSTGNAVDGPFGYGWAASFSMGLSFTASDNTSDTTPAQVTVVQENGATVEFSQDEDGDFVAPPRVFASLTYDATSGLWTFTRRKTEVIVFNADGTLHQMKDLDGNTVTASYTSGTLSELTASGGRSISLTWSGSHISGLTDSAGRTVSYGYTSGNLTSVVAVDGATTDYGYASNRELTSTTLPDGGTTTNVYDSSNRVTSQTDPVGRETTYSYSGSTTTATEPNGAVNEYVYANDRLASETLGYGTAAATTTSYTYDDAGDTLTSVDGLGNTTTYTYDSSGNELTATDPLGHVTTNTYNDLDELLTTTDPLGRVTTNTYDSAGNLLSTTSPSSRVRNFTYNTDGTVDTSEDARGNATSFGYNSAGDLESSTDPDSRATSITRNSAGFITSTTNGAGKITTYTVDAAGRVLTSTDPNSHTTTNTYDADGNPLTTEDPNSHTSSKAYDDADEVTSSTDARGKTTNYTYTDAGKLATTTDPDGNVTTNTWNVLGELVSTENADSHTTSYTYDLDGRKLTTNLPSGDESSTAYNADGEATSTTDAKGKVTTMAYDADGELTSSTDPLSRVTGTSYTADGQVHVVTLPDSSTETYTYNADGQTTEFSNADGKNTTYSYDDADLLTSKVEPGSLETDYSYDSAGRLHVTTNPDSSTLTDSYDDAGQLTTVHSSVSGSTDITYTYDAAGQRATMADETGTTTYSYNADGQATSVENGAGATVGYGYDNAGLMTSIVYPGSHTVTYGHDADGQITSLTDWSSNETDFAWTSDGQLATEANPGGVTETRSYDADDQTTGIADTKSATALADYTYGYDDAGDVASDGTTDSIGTVGHSYAYDPNSQLTTVTTGGTSTAYAASSAGQLTADTNGNTLAYNTAQELTSLTPTTGPATSYTYDGNGSRTASTVAASGGIPSATTSYTYDPEGNLASVTPPGVGGAISYTSDGDGLRQTRTTGGTATDFIWDVSGSLPLLLDDGTHTYLYGPSSAPIAQVDDSTGAIQYLHGDLVGSTRLITDASGTVVGTTEYDPYGNRTNHTGTADTAIGYSGNWADPTTGLVYLRARDYDPATAQFLTVDPLVDQTEQPYAYVADNPLNNSDQTGLCDNMPNVFQLMWATGMVQFDDIANSPLLHALVNGFASLGNAMINHPDLAWQLILGVAGMVGGSAGEAGLGACDATIVGAVPCGAVGVVLGGAIAGSAAYAGNAATQLANDALGSDRVEPWQNTSNGTGGGPKPAKNFEAPTNPPQDAPDPNSLPPGWSVRVESPTQQYPDGYWRLKNANDQYVDPSTGKTPSNVTKAQFQAQTHIPLP
jgi:RHS repeat-associated protein